MSREWAMTKKGRFRYLSLSQGLAPDSHSAATKPSLRDCVTTDYTGHSD